MDTEMTVDARGTRCPKPIIELSQAIDDRAAAVIVLLADDPNARVDVPVWCRLKHHELIETIEDHGAWRFKVRPGRKARGAAVADARRTVRSESCPSMRDTHSPNGTDRRLGSQRGANL